MPSKQAHRPEIEEDLDFQQRNWRVQRVGWALLGLLALAGMAGLLGPGPLSEVDAHGGGDGLVVQYDRFVRHGGQTEVRVSVSRPVSGDVRVAISHDYLDSLKLQQVLPSPAAVQAAGDSVVYVFDRAESGGPLQATFVIQPDLLGMHAARIAVDGGSSVSIRQFTYP